MDLWQRVAQSEAAGHRRYGVCETFGPLVAVSAGAGLPLNSAWHDGSRPPTAAELAAFEAFSAGHGHTPTLHLLSPAAPGMLDLLAAHGYVLDGVVHFYTHDLHRLPAVALDVREEPDPAAWTALAAQGFGPGSENVMGLVAAAPHTRRFVAWLGGEPAGAALLSELGEVAALHGTATRPECRGQGVQQALLAARLCAALEGGGTLATVSAAPGSGSERNIVRAGFNLCAARLTFERRA